MILSLAIILNLSMSITVLYMHVKKLVVVFLLLTPHPQVIKNTLNPSWPPFSISSQTLCSSDPFRKIQVFNYVHSTCVHCAAFQSLFEIFNRLHMHLKLIPLKKGKSILFQLCDMLVYTSLPHTTGPRLLSQYL